MSIRDKLIEFHKAMDVPVLDCPQVPPDDRVRLRASLIVEETLEFLEVCFEDRGNYLLEVQSCLHRVLADKVKVDLVEAADALADIIYVVEGTNLEFGINGKQVFEEVHRSNMAKAGGKRRADGKVLKPDGWTPPDVAGVLEAQKNLHVFHSPCDEQQREYDDLCEKCGKIRFSPEHISREEHDLRKKYGIKVL